MGLQQFERRLERLVEGVFAKAFRGGLQPVEVARRLTRAMDTERVVGVRGTIVPNVFTIVLGPADHERFAALEDTLARDYAEGVREHARDEGYRFAGAVQVAFDVDPGLSPGMFHIRTEVQEGPGGDPMALVLPNGDRVELGEDVVTVGRSPDNVLVLADKTVSTHHAEIRREGRGCVLHDLQSRNGTKVNGRGVKTKELVHGDEITFGTTTVRFEA